MPKIAKLSHPPYKVGVIGAGQLAKMLAQKASELAIQVHLFSDNDQDPAISAADSYTHGPFDDIEALRRFAQGCDVVTYEFESVPISVLRALESDGVVVHPKSETLHVIQDKFRQRQFFQKQGLPVPRFQELEKVTVDDLKAFGFPLVQKLREGGYDGKGVQIVKTEQEARSVLDGDSVIEEFIHIEKELSVIVARNLSGDIQVYDPVEMDMDPQLNLLNFLVSPARVTQSIKNQAQEIAVQVAQALDLIGLCAVEIFLSQDQKLYINEVAPRPHNSGHHTIESCHTSQYEQALRAILNLPLGNTQILSPAVLVNLLGTGSKGKATYTGLNKVLQTANASLHIYGKKMSRPGRKMGHITICDESIDESIQKALSLQEQFKIEGES